MFISKKKFNEAIEKARFETEEKVHRDYRINRIEDEIHTRITQVDNRISGELCRLSQRLEHLEKAMLSPIEINCNEGVFHHVKSELK